MAKAVKKKDPPMPKGVDFIPATETKYYRTPAGEPEYVEAPAKIIKPTPVWSTIAQYVGLAVIAFFIWALYKGGYWSSLYERWEGVEPISEIKVIILGLALAFAWVHKLKWGVVKPFNCLSCMCAWLTLLVALFFHMEYWPAYLPVGLLIGSLFSSFLMRYL